MYYVIWEDIEGELHIKQYVFNNRADAERYKRTLDPAYMPTVVTLCVNGEGLEEYYQ